jgi:peptide/nickel transport system permease protein
MMENAPRSRWARRLAAAVLVAVAAFAVAGPIVIGSDPAAQNLSATLRPPSQAAPLGTDQFGRSVLARLAQASQVSLALVVVSVVTAAIPGVALGLAAAWRGGWVERVLSAIADTMLAIPGLLLILLLVSFAPGEFWLLYLGVSLTLWVEYFRVVRATARRVLHGPQVQASRLLGFDAAYIVRRHVLPEIAPLVTTLMTFGAATTVLAVAALGYINIGLRPPTAELGQMMSEYLPYYQVAPWLMASPVVLLTATVLALAILTDGDERP